MTAQDQEAQPLPWAEWPAENEDATLCGAINASIERYKILIETHSHNEAKDIALASVLDNLTRPRVRLSGLLSKGVGLQDQAKAGKE